MSAEQIEAMLKLKFGASLSQLPDFRKMVQYTVNNLITEEDKPKETPEGKKYFINPPANFVMTIKEYKNLTLEEQITLSVTLTLSGLVENKNVLLYTKQALNRFETCRKIDFSELPYEKQVIDADENKMIMFIPNFNKIPLVEYDSLHEILNNQIHNLASIYTAISKKEKSIKLEYTEENMGLLKVMNITFKINYNTKLIEADFE